jgi:hypothetical protein
MGQSSIKANVSSPQFNRCRTRKLYEPDTMRVQGISAGLHHTVECCVVVPHKSVSGVLDGRRKIILDGEKSLGKFRDVGRAIHLHILIKRVKAEEENPRPLLSYLVICS